MVSELERHNRHSRLEPCRVADDQNPMGRVPETTATTTGAGSSDGCLAKLFQNELVPILTRLVVPGVEEH